MMNYVVWEGKGWYLLHSFEEARVWIPEDSGAYGERAFLDRVYDGMMEIRPDHARALIALYRIKELWPLARLALQTQMYPGTNAKVTEIEELLGLRIKGES